MVPIRIRDVAQATVESIRRGSKTGLGGSSARDWRWSYTQTAP
jgi:hypothetical protein